MRKINVLKANGSIGPMEDGFTVDHYSNDEFSVPTPSNEREAKAIRNVIARKYDHITDNNTISRINNTHRVSKNVMNMSDFGKFENKVVYQYREAKEFKIYSDGTYSYDRVTSEDTNE